MESRPPQDTPRRPAGGRKPNGSGGSPTPPWLWLLLIAGFALIFWQFAPKNEAQVSYSPWFLDQVNEGNVKSLTVQGIEVHGELRKKRRYQPPNSSTLITIEKFYTYFPSEQSIDPVLQKVRQVSDKLKLDPVRIETSPPNT